MTERQCVLFRGVSMIEGWPEKILAADFRLHKKDEPFDRSLTARSTPPEELVDKPVTIVP